MSNGNRQQRQQMPQMSGIQPQMQFSPEAIKSAKEMKCINEIPLQDKPGEFMPCGGEIFVEATRLKYISKIMSPVGKETIATINIGKLCIACGKIFNPDQWMKLQLEIEKATKGTILDKDGKADG
jgi:hypothetical protein